MFSAKRNFGNLGEKAAAKFLKGLGYTIVESNFENKQGRKIGEIDIIVRDNENKELVFVEVKTRNMAKYSQTLPEENITYQKLRRMEKAANIYLLHNKLGNEAYRFDAISVWLNGENNQARVKHIKSL
jgi:putative endonuclease